MTQKEALEILKTGRNVFLTGEAGSGKTYVLREYIKYLDGLNAEVGITASTGIAATHMGGMTIHSWSGVGIRDNLNKEEIQAIIEKRKLKEKLKNVSVLIIDEVSMLHHYLLDLVDAVLREARDSSEPFGGIQVVLCGDFFQLPPVRRAGDREAFFAYHSEVWKARELNLKICYLTEQHRQNDLSYVKALNGIRGNRADKETIAILETRFGQNSKEGAATRLYSHNTDVDRENENELRKLTGKIFEYDMFERGKRSSVESLKKSCLAPEILRLKEGAKVMFVKNNFEEGYVNGTLGTVERCGSEEIKVRTLAGQTIDAKREVWRIEEDGKVRAEVSQYPLRLAWAITVHKSQGMSLDEAEIDLSKSFEKGMGYVALSRVRTLGGLFLKGLNQMALKVNEEVLEFDKKFQKMSEANSFHIRTMGKEKISKMHAEFKKKIERPAPVSGPHGKHRFRGAGQKTEKVDTVTQTRQMLEEGMMIKDIASKRDLKPETIIGHIEEIKFLDPSFNIYNLRSAIPSTRFKNIYAAFRKVGLSPEGKYRLAPVKELLGPKFSYDDLRLVRLFL